MLGFLLDNPTLITYPVCFFLIGGIANGFLSLFLRPVGASTRKPIGCVAHILVWLCAGTTLIYGGVADPTGVAIPQMINSFDIKQILSAVTFLCVLPYLVGNVIGNVLRKNLIGR